MKYTQASTLEIEANWTSEINRHHLILGVFTCYIKLDSFDQLSAVRWPGFYDRQTISEEGSFKNGKDKMTCFSNITWMYTCRFVRYQPTLTILSLSQIHFHLPDSETLNEHVPKEVLPVEYGGSGGSMSDIKQDWLKKIKSSRWVTILFSSIIMFSDTEPAKNYHFSDYLMDQKNWKIDENKRKGGATALNQGIRSLSID